MNKYSKELIQGKDCIILPLREKIELFTTDWENIYPINIDRVSKHLASDHFIKITVGNGREIIVTPEHPLFHIENCQIKTIDAENAKLGMWVPVPLDIQIKGATQKFNIFKEDCFIERAQQHISVPMENGPNFFKIIGYMLAEGSKETNRGKLIGINFSNKDTRLLDDFEQSMMYLFNLKPYRQPRTDEYGTRYTTRYISRELAKFVEKICPEILNKASGKQIPAICLKGKKQDIALMLSCMFEGDGHVSKKPKTIRVGFASNSIKICKQVQDLLLRFSIRSNLTEHKESYKVSITGKNNIAKFYEDIKFVTKEKNKIIEDYLANIIAIRSIKNNVPGVATEVIDFMQKYGIKKLKNNLLATMKHDYLKRNKNISRGLLQELIKNIKPINEDQNKYEFLRKMAFGNIGFEKIISIETIKNNNQKWTYDVTIEPTHNFISQNLVLHNTISISKANIQATLKCATTVLAAANPKYGRFDPFEVIAKQINLPPALMSRFDLIFPIRDMPDHDKDKKTAMHMLKLHQAPMSQEAELSTDFLKKYICYARQRMHPVLTDGAVEEIEDYYLKMRSSGSTEGGTPTVPISPRQLEALIRLSEASAKLRMSDKVTRKDAKNASDILQNCLEAIGLDPDTGKLDIDRISSGISASQRGKIHQIKEIIDTIEKAIGEKNIPVDEIVKAAQAKNIEDSTVYEILEKLRISGDVFEPKRGFISKL